MDEWELLKGIRGRNEETFGYIIKNYSRLLWAVAGNILGCREEIEECISDVFAELWNNPLAYSPERGALKTYLVVKTKSKALDRYRKMHKEQLRLLPMDKILPEMAMAAGTGLEEEEDYRQLYEAIADLGEPNREIMLRRFFYGEKTGDIAKRMGIPVKEVENRLYRGKQRLRKWMEKEGLEYEIR